jgi:hypothetical protein
LGLGLRGFDASGAIGFFLGTLPGGCGEALGFFLGGLFRAQGALGRLKSVQAAQLYRHVFIDGAGVRLLLGDAQFGEAVQNLMGLDFQLPRQLVDPNLLHRQSNLLLLAETLLMAAVARRAGDLRSAL